MKPSLFESFVQKYQISKTLCFELIPQGKTLEHIESKGLLDDDEKRNENYKKVRKILDEYHKSFINNALDGFNLDFLKDYSKLYFVKEKNEGQKEELSEIEKHLKKQVQDRFSKHPNSDINKQFKNLFTNQLFKTDLLDFVTTQEEKELVEGFQKFTAYFNDYNRTREQFYKADSKGIAYRVVVKNLPIFLDNLQTFELLKNSSLNLQFNDIIASFQAKIPFQSFEEFFNLHSFNGTLQQIGIDIYNAIIAGYTTHEGNQKVLGLNEYINQYNQNQLDSKNKLPLFKKLYKQLLSDKTLYSFAITNFENDGQLLNTLFELHQIETPLIEDTKALLEELHSLDTNLIYIKNDANLNELSKRMFNRWSFIKDAIYNKFEKEYTKKNKLKLEQDQIKYFKSQDSFSIAYLNECIDLYIEYLSTDQKVNIKFKNIEQYLNQNALFEQIPVCFEQVQEIINDHTTTIDNNLLQNNNSIHKIKQYLDALKHVHQHIKPLLGSGEEANRNEVFYSRLQNYNELFLECGQIYNKSRNYLTRKPYTTEKIKLNFNIPTLLNGWDSSREEQNCGILLLKDNNYFLGVLDKKHNRILRDIPVDVNPKESSYQKVNYKLIPGVNKMLPRVFFSAKHLKNNTISDDIVYIRNHSTHTKGGLPQEGYSKKEFNLVDCHKMIDFYKQCMSKKEEWSKFNFQFSETSSYKGIDEFYQEVEDQAYTIDYTTVSENYISSLVEEGKLYLFQLYNKDFSKNSKGTPNLHTLYWKMLFHKDNLKDVVYKLNGNADIYYRKKSIDIKKAVVHKANEAIKNKNELNQRKESVFSYDIIKNKRYTVDKFLFHVPISMNSKCNSVNNINTAVNEQIQKNNFEHIIGVSKDLKHLLYLSIIDLQGNIVKQFSLNEILNIYKEQTYATNYFSLLKSKESNIEEAKKNWQTVDSIKNLKEGYLSQVVHVLCKLITEYNALVFMEESNYTHFESDGIEKSVYQNFQKMLIDKLNYYVNKNKNPNELSGQLKALQLSNIFESYIKMGRQSGVLFFIPASHTQFMDPSTGFVNFLKLKYENIQKSQSFFKRFDSISYNKAKDYFEFNLDYHKFYENSDMVRNKWTICSSGKRILNTYSNKKMHSEEIILTNAFKSLFENHKIEYKEVNIIKQIANQSNKTFFEELFTLMKLTMQMNNRSFDDKTEFFISPVLNKDGVFYTSLESKVQVPNNIAANGAFNMARKGLWLYKQIQKATETKKIKLTFNNKDWLAYNQS